MDYKSLANFQDEDYSIYSIYGLYDNFKISIINEGQYCIREEFFNNEHSLRQTCNEFYVVISVLQDKTSFEEKLENQHIKILKIETEDQFYEKFRELLERLNIFTMCFQSINTFQSIFREYGILQWLSEFVEVSEESSQSDQSNLQVALFIILNSAKRSKNLCKWIIKFGILYHFTLYYDNYNASSKSIICKIFSEIYRKKINEGELGFINFIMYLAEKLITVENYENDPDETSLVSEILFCMNEYELFNSDDENAEKRYRLFISGKAVYIFANRMYNCYNSALNGICHLAERSWFIENFPLIIKYIPAISITPTSDTDGSDLITDNSPDELNDIATTDQAKRFTIKLHEAYHPFLDIFAKSIEKVHDKDDTDLLKWTLDIFTETENPVRLSFIAQIFEALFRKAPKVFDPYYSPSAKDHIQEFIELLSFPNYNNLHYYSFKLYVAIIERFPDLIDFFANNRFLGLLYDSVQSKNYRMKLEFLKMAALLFTMHNINFISCFFSAMIGHTYILTLASMEPTDPFYIDLFKGILDALFVNPELVSSLIIDLDVVDDMSKIVPTNEELGSLLEKFFTYF